MLSLFISRKYSITAISRYPYCSQFYHEMIWISNWKVFFTSLVWCFVREPVYFMDVIFPHPAYEAGCVDSKSSVCIVIGWVGGRNVLMHKYIRHWNYNLMVCGIREGGSRSLHSPSLFYSWRHPSPSLRSGTCIHSLPILSFLHFLFLRMHKTHIVFLISVGMLLLYSILEM